MTREEMIILASKSGGIESLGGPHFSWAELEQFTRIVEQRKCKELADKIARMPFGDTAASFAAWVRAEHDVIACAADAAGFKERK